MQNLPRATPNGSDGPAARLAVARGPLPGITCSDLVVISHQLNTSINVVRCISICLYIRINVSRYTYMYIHLSDVLMASKEGIFM